MTTPRMPAIFIGHGTPMNALEKNQYTHAWAELAKSLPKPKAILAISAHWYIKGTAVTAVPQPKTIHDFYGFPQELFAMRYPAPGSPVVAQRARELLAPVSVTLDRSWGLDHGTWSVLVHMYPDADVPVVQLSIDATQPANFHYELGKLLGPLRDEGVLLFGSGDVVHNLRLLERSAAAPPFDWAVQFNTHVRERILRRDHPPLLQLDSAGRAAQLAVPTPEHYLPLLYVLGAQAESEVATIVCDGIDLGSISMMAVAVGI